MASTVPGFLPSSSGFRFANSFPPLPLPIQVQGLGELKLGDASGGLCGGMVFAVRDCFESKFSVPTVADPPTTADDPLFRYLSRRLVDSLHLPAGVLKYFAWMNRPDADYLGLAGVWSLTARTEWPVIQAVIDGGRPAPLGLVTVKSFNPRALGQNHQVLAYRYDLDQASGSLQIGVYDPNCPGQDGISLSLNLTEPAGIRYSTGLTVRGFFLTPYTPADIEIALDGAMDRRVAV
jgi:hypothetical protein